MAEPEDERRAESAPEGSHCATHPERTALVTCPRCGDYCCIACWHNALSRCHACLMRDPGPMVPWADDRLGPGARFFGTIAGVLRPRGKAPAFARGHWRRGVSFWLLTFVPLALLSGIIPYTHRLAFGDRFGVAFLGGEPTAAELALDVAQAAGLGLLVQSVLLGLLAVPYVHLTNAYGRTTESGPAQQAILYRGWLLPLGQIVLGLIVWGLPMEPTETAQLVTVIARLAPLLLLLSSMSGAARMAAGVGPVAALAVVLVPFLLMFLAEPMIHDLLSPWLPDAASLQETVGE
ncbi:MAG TPA: hypothetical protein RMH99_12205 [Sandaracinaceae bacterium LLY-WYZ-13_1]|nr:hypothetical protein [Sandaracinaceae bacterium LLY-WYZ-13_1]